MSRSSAKILLPLSNRSLFEGLSGPLITFDENYVRRLFSRITLFDDKVVFAFKDGNEVTIKE